MTLALNEFIRDLISGAHPIVQGIVLAAILFLVGFFWRRSAVQAARRVACESDLAQVRERNTRLNEALLRERDVVHALLAKVGQGGSAAAEVSGRDAELRAELEEAAVRLQAVVEEKDRYVELLQVAKEQGSRVWSKPALPDRVPYASSRPPNRTTRYIAFLNLKGGVGKTTLTANLAAAYATGAAGSPLRVLVVDLDHQATLTGLCATSRDWARQRENGACSDRLIMTSTSEEVCRALMPELVIPFDGLASGASIISARGELEDADTRALLEFVFDEHDVRLRLRAMFHQPWVQERFDLVIFDCPPRLTASCFGALPCTDQVFVPVAPTQHDLDALPRITEKVVEWTEDLPSVLRPRLGGIILNRVLGANSLDGLPSTDAATLAPVRQFLASKGHSEKLIFNAVVPKRKQIAGVTKAGTVLGMTATGRQLFGPVALELLERIRQ